MRTVRFLTKCFSAPNHPTDGEHPKNASDLKSPFLPFFSNINGLFFKLIADLFNTKHSLFGTENILKINLMTMFGTKQSLIGNLYFKKIENRKKICTKNLFIGTKQSLNITKNFIKITNQTIISTKDCHEGITQNCNYPLISINFIINRLFYNLFSSNPLKQKVKEKLSFKYLNFIL